MIRRPPRSTLSSSSAASDVYKRQALLLCCALALSAAHGEADLAKCGYKVTYLRKDVPVAQALAVAQHQGSKLTLGTFNGSAAGMHPLLFEIGVMNCTIMLLPGEHVWREANIVVPHLTAHDYSGEFGYQARAWMNTALAQVGDGIEGLEHTKADISTASVEWLDQGVVEGKTPVLQAHFSAPSTPMLSAGAMKLKSANFAALSAMKDLAMFGYRIKNSTILDSCTHLRYHWDRTTVRAGVSGNLTWQSSPLDGIEAGSSFEWGAGEDQAFELQAFFDLTLPCSCPK
eukprot:TRINITY_DN7707_c0_g1_i1.p1 TRINITY_DN7707_c0_g1~~TRINITY_DN7707_c0_g1_i1.p1  ORF type:complete len:287 (+),score=87.56 TRINITY_DN7707_c0_g1_i1:110-970(+)